MRPGFGRRVAVAVLLALTLAIVLQVVTAEGPDAVSGGVGGDFSSFYAAGDVVLGDVPSDPERLYDPDAQFAAQEPVLPADRDGNLFFAYPAFFVGPYVALAVLDFGAAYLVHTAAMAAAFAIAVALVRPMSRTARAHPLETFTIALTFFPLFRGVTGGQNTALTVLLVAVVWRSLHDGRDVPAGIAAALLLFKPPLALPFLGALVLARRWRGVAAAMSTGSVLYVAGALLTDLSWPQAWLDAVRFLDRADTPFNVQNFVSVPGFAEAVFGIDSVAATRVGVTVAIAAIAVVSWTWWRDLGDLDGRIALTAAGALVISPHALYYDAGLLVLVALVVVEWRPGLRRWVPVLWAAGLTHLAADALGCSPLVGLVIASFLLAFGIVQAPAVASEPEPVRT